MKEKRFQVFCPPHTLLLEGAAGQTTALGIRWRVGVLSRAVANIKKDGSQLVLTARGVPGH